MCVVFPSVKVESRWLPLSDFATTTNDEPEISVLRLWFGGESDNANREASDWLGIVLAESSTRATVNVNLSSRVFASVASNYSHLPGGQARGAGWCRVPGWDRSVLVVRSLAVFERNVEA